MIFTNSFECRFCNLMFFAPSSDLQHLPSSNLNIREVPPTLTRFQTKIHVKRQQRERNKAELADRQAESRQSGQHKRHPGRFEAGRQYLYLHDS